MTPGLRHKATVSQDDFGTITGDPPSRCQGSLERNPGQGHVAELGVEVLEADRPDLAVRADEVLDLPVHRAREADVVKVEHVLDLEELAEDLLGEVVLVLGLLLHDVQLLGHPALVDADLRREDLGLATLADDLLAILPAHHEVTKVHVLDFPRHDELLMVADVLSNFDLQQTVKKIL